MSHPSQFPPIPSLAFSEGSAPLWGSELFEAIIYPKKERESPFKVRRRCASTVTENSPGIADPNVWSPPVRAIVGTREKMETWLRESGPGSSCLWVQIENVSLDSHKKILSGQLKLSYRLRCEQSLSVLLLNGTLLELAPGTQKEGWKKITKKNEILLSEDSDRGSSRTAHGNTTGILSPNPDGSPSLGWKSVGAANEDKTVNLVMPERAYRQLLQMVSPGGVLREYQSLLRRAAENSNFLDVDFQLVDLQKWLREQHPFAVFWEETDVVVVRTEAEGLKWILLRFDFEEGVIRSTEGATVCTLEITFGNKPISKIYASRKSWWGDASAGDVICKAKEKELEEVRSKLEWKIWESVYSAQKYPSVSLLSRILIDILGNSATVSASEIESVKFLFNSDPCEGSIHEQVGITRMSAIQTTFTSRGRKGLTGKEKHALAILRSDSEDLRLEAICTLLELLLGVGDGARSTNHSKVLVHSKSPPSHSNPDTSRSSSIVWLHSDQEDIESSYREQLRKQSKSREAAEMSDTTDRQDLEVERNRQPRTVAMKEYIQGVDCEVGLPRVGSQTERAPTGTEEQAKREVGVMQITEWVKDGFLEVLVENLITRFRDAHKQDDKTEKTVQFNFETVLEACLKVLELLPGEGTSRMISLILHSLHEHSEVLAKLSCADDKVGEGAKDGEKSCSSVSSKGMGLMLGNKSVQRSQTSHESKLQESFAKALGFSKLLFAVITRSSVLSGSLAVSGGLDLVLDFYSCLVRKFPFNLRLGAKSVVRNSFAEGVLPGEVLKSQVEPLKVLPCIFPSVCICKVAQTCLMDSTLYPVQEKVDLTALTAAGDSSCDLKQFGIGSDSDVGSELCSGETCNNSIERLLTLTTGRTVVKEANRCGLTLHGNLNSDGLNGNVEVKTEETAVTMLPCHGSMFDFYRAPSETTDVDCFKDLEIPTSPEAKQRRPYVPRLPLNCIQLSNSKSGPATAVGSKVSGQPTSASLTDSVDLASSMHSCSSSHFDILRAVSDVKYELLRSMANLFATRSLSFMRTRGYLHQKLQRGEDHQLVLRFLPDMIGGFLDTSPAPAVWRTKKILLQVVSVLDKSELCGDICAAQGLNLCRGEDAQGGPRWSGPGPPPVSDEGKRSVDVLLLEIGERLTCMLCHLTETLTKSEAFGKAATSKETCTAAGAEVCCEPSLLIQTLYSGHLLSLWVDIGILLKFLGDFVLLWPEEGSVRLLLKSCGKPVKMVFGLLAKLSSQSDWNLAQILAMQHLFNFSTACMNSAAHNKSRGPQVWNEVDDFFWQLLMVSDSNWTCVKNFADWVLLKSCQGCVETLLEGYQKVLWEPLEIYYGLFGQKVSPPQTLGRSPDSFGGGEILKKSVLPLLRASILMMKKKLKCQCQSSRASPILYMSRLIFLLDFLMNPLDGLLITVIKAPVSYAQLNKMQRETVTSSGSNFSKSRRVKDQSIFPCTPQPILSANKEQLGTVDTKGLCRKCATSFNGTTCFQKFTSSMKHECISILADIFNLKAFDASEEQTNLCINPRTQNPFLFRKYVNPFLEVIFFCFLKCYSDRGECSERELQLPLFMCPLSRCWVTEFYGRPTYYVLERNVNTAEESPDGRTLLSSKDKAELETCSIRSHEDEAASVACIQYARVLLALAQNPTDDVSQCFQHVRVMNLLVQQIGLEYEVSQVATPREIVQAERANNTPSVSAKLQFQGHSDADVKIHRGAHNRREDRSSSSELSTIREGESIQKELCERLEDDGELEVQGLRGTSCLLRAKNSQVSRSPSSSVRLKVKLSPVVLFKEEFQLDRILSQTSKRTSKEQTLYTLPELVGGSCLRASGCCLGFHSARDIRSTDFAKRQSYCILLDQPLLRSQQTQMKLQKAITLTEEVPKSLLPFRERNRNILPNHQVLSERGTSSTWTLFQRGRRSSTTFNKNSLGKKENGIERSDGIRSHVVPLTMDEKVSLDFSVQNQPAPEREKEIGNAGSKSKAVKYTGRFFDLNEEVERELAEEESPTWGSRIVEGAESTEAAERLPNDSLLEQRGLQQLTDQRATAVYLGDLQSLVSVSQPESTRGLNCGTTTKRKPARPAIPRLNLPKSVRKGGQDVISDTNMDLELLLSTTSTQESKGRLSSLLELQKEFVDSDKDEKTWRPGSYETERLRRRLYRHPGLHVLLLELYVALMLNMHMKEFTWSAKLTTSRTVIFTTCRGTLEACYSDRFPMENRKLNAPFFLSYPIFLDTVGPDLNHAANSYLLPCLSKRMKDFKPAAYRILKLTWRALFTPTLYTNRIHIAHGAFAQVYTATVRGESVEAEDRVVLKVIDVPRGPHDPCRFFDVFSEVEILERFVGEPRVSQILDYGVEAESFVLVLKHYKCSLRAWRERQQSISCGGSRLQAGVQQQAFYKTLPLYLEVYSAVLQAVKVLEAENVVHYDLKCDNILLEPAYPSCPESDFWTPIWPPANASNPLPFRVCIADFGQSKASLYLGGECTVRNRGTEYVKSPEMLKLLSSQSQRGSDSNVRQAGEAVGKAVDVWSLGCLLYELLTGEYLLYDDDWLRFFIRVTVSSEELIPQEKAAKLDNYGPVIDLLRFVLVRDPIQRPTLDDLTICVEQLQLKVLEEREANKSKFIDLPRECSTIVINEGEFDADSDSSLSDGQTLEPLDIKLNPNNPQQRGHPLKKCLLCLNRLICQCDCVRE